MLIIGVIGAGSQIPKKIDKIAEEVGEEIAKRGAVLICGGLGGVMESASRGAKKSGGTTIGVLPGNSSTEANEFIDIPIVTGLGIARNIVIIKSSSAVIAINGSYGTLSEIAFALQLGVPIVGIETWEVSENVFKANTAKEAVDKVFDLIKK